MPTTAPEPAEPRSAGPALSSELRIAVMRLARRMRQERATDTYTMSQLSALATLEREGALTLGALAAAEKVQPPSMTRIVASLEQAGLVRRTPHPTDGRQIHLAATPAGVKLLAADRLRRDAWLAKRLAELNVDERATLHDAAEILGRLAQS
ncbi:MAG TPA: MarR family transcriptional regulator [Mycobacteriales bacterium]|nr:MarR family transcriptional regulator [Mycobacteriales bacterium]